jgi:all-trans-retinol dehydrogenase (NAD+)
MKQLKGKIVLVTGGASGIGKIMVRLLLERAAKVIIWDINELKIAETISEFSNKGTILGFTIDVSNVNQIKETALKVKEEIGAVDLLINNAGIVAGKYSQNSGHICNIASSGGLISNPKMSVYAASKWSLVGWSDSLRLEMEQLKKNINVTTIMPYFINTGMFDGVQSKLPILNPEVAALTIIKAIEKNKRMVTIPGYIYRLIKLGQGLMSINVLDWFAGNVLGIYKTMEHFTGHKK